MPRFVYLIPIRIEPHATGDPPASIIELGPVCALPDLVHVLRHVIPCRRVCVQTEFTAVVGVASSTIDIIVSVNKGSEDVVQLYTLPFKMPLSSTDHWVAVGLLYGD